jgi:hypothetical protein
MIRACPDLLAQFRVKVILQFDLLIFARECHQISRFLLCCGENLLVGPIDTTLKLLSQRFLLPVKQQA